MSDILSKNPKLEDVLRKAVDRIGQNHAKARDTQGVTLSNEGTTHQYDSTHGIHPSRIGQKPTKGREAYRVLGEQKDLSKNLKDKTSVELETLRQKEIKRIKTEVNGHPQSAVKSMIRTANEKFKKLIDAAKQRERKENLMKTGIKEQDGRGPYVTRKKEGIAYEWLDIERKLEAIRSGIRVKNLDEIKAIFRHKFGNDVIDELVALTGNDVADKIIEKLYKGPTSRLTKKEMAAFTQSVRKQTEPGGGDFMRGERDQGVDDLLKKIGIEMEEATGSGSSGGYEAPLFGDWKEEDMDEVMESVIKESVSHILLEEKLDNIIEDELDELWIGLNYDAIEPAYDFKSQGPFNGRMTGPGYTFKSQGPMNEDTTEKLKERIIKKVTEHYISGKLKYEKPNTKGGFKDNTPGLEVTAKTLKADKKLNTDYYKTSEKKIKDYLDIKNNSHPEFPHQNNSKTDYKSPMYRNTPEEEEFIDDFRGMGLEDANSVENLSRLSDYLSGSQETGNAQTDKEGKALGNVVVNKLGDKIEKKIKRKREKIAKRKSKMTNLKGITPDVQTVVKEEVNKDMNKIKHLFSYNQKTQ